MDRWILDLRFALRQIRRRPLFTVAAVGTLALGIGTATAVFSVTDTVLLRPLPFPEPERLVVLQHTLGGRPVSTSEPEYLDYRSDAATFEQLAAFDELLDRVRALLGVAEAGAVWELPTVGGAGASSWSIAVEGRSAASVSEAPDFSPQFVTPGAFEALGVELVAGRLFDPGDLPGGRTRTVRGAERPRRRGGSRRS